MAKKRCGTKRKSRGGGRDYSDATIEDLRAAADQMAGLDEIPQELSPLIQAARDAIDSGDLAAAQTAVTDAVVALSTAGIELPVGGEVILPGVPAAEEENANAASTAVENDQGGGRRRRSKKSRKTRKTKKSRKGRKSQKKN